MGTIVLTSCGIRNKEFKKHFYEIVPKKELKNKKVLYITTAIDGKEYDCESWIPEEFKTILDLGIKRENITEYKIGNPLDIDQYDIMYMLGGNTIHLMYMINKYHFGEFIKEFLKRGKIYIGSSAGSQVLGNSIETCVPFNRNDVNMTDFTALGLVNGIIIPHANKREEYIKSLDVNGIMFLLFDGDGIIIDR